MSIQLRWLGTACFEIRLATGETLIIDPYMDESLGCPISTEEVHKADLICITHGHFDHILDVGKLVNRLGSNVVCSSKVSQNIQKQFHIPVGQIKEVTAGEVLKFGSFQIETVKGVHINNRQYFAQQFDLNVDAETSTEDLVRAAFGKIEDKNKRKELLSHLGKFPAGEQLNYIFQLPGNLRFYFCGSVPDPQLFSIVKTCNAQILILQILAGMEKAAVHMAEKSGASIVIPSHHDAFIPGQKLPDLNKVSSLLDSTKICFLDPIPGTWYEANLLIRRV